MINNQKEIWISTFNRSTFKSAIIAVSNCGRIMRKNGKIEFSKLRLILYIGKKRERCYIHQYLARHFIKKSETDKLYKRDIIDHITHTPINYNVNDVRNLRWCTHKENANFEEAKLNRSTALKGHNVSDETRAKLSVSLKGKNSYPKTKEHKEKIATTLKNRKLTDKHKQHISDSQIGCMFYTNGIKNIRVHDNAPPSGYWRGMTRHKKSVQ